MDNYSSKICTKCYSVQEPHSRFCDNCGKGFAATAATDGNISIVTKTFLKKQVAETRPLFWLCIIIVGMLGVFGFAQAGLYLAEPVATTAVVSQRPVNFVSSETAKPTTVPMTVEEMAVPANDALDLNNSVFEMRDVQTSRSPATKRKLAVAPKPKADTARSASTEAHTNAAADVAPAKLDLPEKPAEKPADTGTRKYIRGPMGGCYYISASGSKRYVDRGLCS